MDNEDKKVSNDVKSLIIDKLSDENLVEKSKENSKEKSLEKTEQISENIGSQNIITLEPKNYILLSEAFYEGFVKRVLAYSIDLFVCFW